MKKVIFKKKYRKVLILAGALILLGAGIYLAISLSKQENQYKTAEENNQYVRFDMEVYDIISDNYWMSPDLFAKNNFPELYEIFRLSLLKAQGVTDAGDLKANGRSELAKILYDTFDKIKDDEGKKELAVKIAAIALASLPPEGRNSLQTDVQREAFFQVVNNINPSNNLYDNLGVEAGANNEKIEKIYEEKKEILEKSTSTEAKAELEKITYAYEVLSDSQKKSLYDETQMEPTVFYYIVGKTLYIYINRFSATTFQEFGRAIVANSGSSELNSMIIDLRGNIGGFIDYFVPNFFGLFIGQNQYVYDLYSRGDYKVQRTSQPKFDELKKYKEIAVLTDGMTKSTSELTAETLRHFNLAHIVGTVTGGWGTIEKSYPINTVISEKEKYSMLLVNSITLREDNLPIQDYGVIPDVDMGNINWKKDLKKYFNSASIINALTDISAKPPTR